MAIGAITKVLVRGRVAEFVDGERRVHVKDVQLTSGANYTTGGETITPKLVGLDRIDGVRIMGLALPVGGATSRSVGVIYLANGSVKLVVHTTASAEAVAASDQSTFKVRCEFIGKRAI